MVNVSADSDIAAYCRYCTSKILSYRYLLGNRDAGGTAGVQLPKGQEILLHSTASRLALGPTEPPIQRVSGALPQG
jgi:hypothetical protein